MVSREASNRREKFLRQRDLAHGGAGGGEALGGVLDRVLGLGLARCPTAACGRDRYEGQSPSFAAPASLLDHHSGDELDVVDGARDYPMVSRLSAANLMPDRLIRLKVGL